MPNTHARHDRFVRQTIEVGLHFLKVDTLATLLPLLLLTLVCAAVDQLLLVTWPGPARMLCWILLQGILVGRFALAARDGDFHADLYSAFRYGRLPAFALVFMLANLIWALPVLGFIWVRTPFDEIRLSGLLEWLVAKVYLAGSSPFRPDLGFWMVLILIFAVAVLPFYLSLLVLQVKKMGDWLHWSFWCSPLREGTLFAIPLLVFLGALSLVFLGNLPILGGASVLAFRVSPTLGSIFAGLTVVLPLVAAPIILGRLAGTWAYYQKNTDTQNFSIDSLVGPIAAQVAVEPDISVRELAIEPPKVIPELPLESSQALEAGLAQVRNWEETQTVAAARKLVELRRQFPTDVRLRGLELELLLRLGKVEKVRPLVPVVMEALLKEHQSDGVARLLRLLGKNAWEYAWTPEQKEQMVRSLLNMRYFAEAGQCAHGLELQRGQAERAGKRLVQVADQAAAAKEYGQSVALLRYYVKHHPDGPFADYAHKAIAFNLKQETPNHG